MSPESDPNAVEREIRIGARPEAVFPYFTDPARMTRWMGVDCKLDASPGGSFRIDVNGHDVAGGHFVAVEPPGHLVFTWGWEGSEEMPPGSTTVEIHLVADGDTTIVRLVHRGLPPAQVAPHAEGWSHHLGLLAAAVSG